MSRNIPERGRMTPEWKGMDKNGTGTYRNEPEWHRNILKWAGMRLEWARIWSAEPEKGKMWCFSFPFFSFFNGGRRGVSLSFREQFCFILTGLLCNDQSEWSWANLKTCILIRVAVCGLSSPRLVGFFPCEWCNNCPSVVPHLMFPLFSLTGLSDGVSWPKESCWGKRHLSTRVYVSPQDCSSNKAEGRNCMN